MKLTKEEFERTRTNSTFELFLDGIKAEQTKKKYVRTLRKILCDILEDFLDGTLEQRSNDLVKTAKQDFGVNDSIAPQINSNFDKLKYI